MSSSKRPELQAPPEVYYDEVEAGKYLHNSRMIDVQAQMFLFGTEIDYVDDKFESGFVFRNPNEKGRCGCGESFNV